MTLVGAIDAPSVRAQIEQKMADSLRRFTERHAALLVAIEAYEASP